MKHYFLFPILFSSLVMAKQSYSEKIFTSASQNFKFEELTQQKNIIWGFDFLSDKRILFSERNGSLKIFDSQSKTVTEVKAVPEVWAYGQGGLLDVRVHPKIKDRIYLSYSEPHKKEAGTSVIMATLKDNTLINLKKIFTGNNISDESIHFGSRLEFDDKGFLFISVGERNARDKAQQVSFHNGKILRIKDDGSVPSDNPFAKDSRAKPEVWSLGHRNPQGLVRHPDTGDLWVSEMGPRGGDELNLVKPGANYGWPVITYGREYYGPKIGEGTEKPGIEQPIVYWVPSISPSGMTIYKGQAFPHWSGNIFIGNLSGTHLRRIVLSGQKVAQQEELLKDLSLRIRNVRSGPDGFLYLSTDSGILARLVPSK